MNVGDRDARQPPTQEDESRSSEHGSPDHNIYEDDTIQFLDTTPFDASLVNRELLTKSKIAKSETPAVGENQVEQSNERENQLNHCYQNVRTAGLAVK